MGTLNGAKTPLNTPISRPYIMGIDPGFTGAVAITHITDMTMTQTFDMPVHTIDKTKSRPMGRLGVNAEKLSEIVKTHAPQTLMAVVEDLDARPGQSAQSQWRFATGYGMILGILASHQIMVFPVKPAVWKAIFNLSSNKTESLTLAKKLYPQLARTHLNLAKHDGRAEALILAHYGRLLLGG